MSAEHSIVAEDLFLSGAGMIFHFHLSFFFLTSSSIIFFFKFPSFRVDFPIHVYIYIRISRLISSFFFFFFLSTIQRETIYFSISRRYLVLTNEDEEMGREKFVSRSSIIDASSRSRIRKTDTNRIKRISRNKRVILRQFSLSIKTIPL